MNVVKIFLATSSELVEERNQFQLFLNRQNKNFEDKNIYLQLEQWEDFIDSKSQPEFRNEYFNAITNSEIFVSIFHTTAGKYIVEEFEIALTNHRAGQNPQYIFTYFKETYVASDQIKPVSNELYEFKNKLRELGHYYTAYSNVSDLTSNFNSQLERILISKNPSFKNERSGIFISYSHKNKEWRDQLLLYLKPLKNKGHIKVWSDKDIEIGANWSKSIEQSLLEAKIGLLLITQEFLASDFISDEELPKLIEYSEMGCIIVPVILEPCTIQYEEGLKQFQFFNSPDKPFSSLNVNDRKAEFVKLTEALINLYKKE